MLKNKLTLVVAAVVVVLIAVVSVSMLSQKRTAAPTQAASQAQQVLALSPEAVGLDIAFRSDNKAMKFTLNNASDITAAEYQISYTKDVKGSQVPEGLIGTVDVTPGNKTAGIGYREFGTCSSGICRYDNVVSSIKLTLKVSKTDGKIYQVEKTVDLPAK